MITRPTGCPNSIGALRGRKVQQSMALQTHTQYYQSWLPAPSAENEAWIPKDLTGSAQEQVLNG